MTRRQSSGGSYAIDATLARGRGPAGALAGDGLAVPTATLTRAAGWALTGRVGSRARTLQQRSFACVTPPKSQVTKLEEESEATEADTDKRLSDLKAQLDRFPTKALEQRIDKLLGRQSEVLAKHQKVVTAVMRKAQGEASLQQKKVPPPASARGGIAWVCLDGPPRVAGASDRKYQKEKEKQKNNKKRKKKQQPANHLPICFLFIAICKLLIT